MYKCKPFVSADNEEIIKILFHVDEGSPASDEIVVNILERWVDDEVYAKSMPRDKMYFTISPDTGEVEVYTMTGSIVVRCLVGVVEEEDGEFDIIDSGEGLFIIRNEVIEEFTYDGGF